MRLMERRGLWFILSLIVMIPGIVYMIWSLATRGTLLPLSIDYTGGTAWEVRFDKDIAPADVRQVFVDAGYGDTSVYTIGDNRTVQIKLKPIDPAQKQDLVSKLTEKIGPPEERQYNSVGPSIGSEVSRSALIAVIVSSLLILGYLAWSFRTVPHPFRYGVCAVIALIHDVLVTISFVCIMNWIAGWEIDALFLTAILTVIGYSVSDSVVVFDRIRENMRRIKGEDFTLIANRSIVETAARSVGTGLTTILTLLAILVLGGPTLQQFMSVMIVGIISGCYSSIFNATALLVAWEERSFFHREENSYSVSNRPVSA